MFSFFSRKINSPLNAAKVLFKEKGIIDATNFKASCPEDSLGYLSACIVYVFSDGEIKVLSDDNEKQLLENFSVLNVISASNNINNYDPMFSNTISLMTAEKAFRFEFSSCEIKNKFWSVLDSTMDALKKQKDLSSHVHLTVNDTDHTSQASLNQKGKVKEYVGILCSITGYFRHSFRDENGEVFSVGSSVSSMPDIYLKGFGKKLWCNNMDSQITLFPGVQRNVTDENDNCFGSYICSGFDSMSIQIENQQLKVTVTDLGWIFYDNSEEVARISRLPEEGRKKGHENGFDTEIMYFVEISEKLAIDWYPLIFGTPMIGF